MPANRKNYIGQRFGSLIVIADAPDALSPSGKILRRVMIRCDCGVEKIMYLTGLRTNRSCGCSWAPTVKHGCSYTPTYRCWADMLNRCQNPNIKYFHCYGGRGITVCERWKQFENFLADMGHKPNGRTLDRINNDGNYEPTNCRWATPAEQGHRILTIKGVTDCVVGLAKHFGLASSTVFNRLHRGWSAERAFTTPPRKMLKHPPGKMS